jgi:adenosylhomocysteine nucleosidase
MEAGIRFVVLISAGSEWRPVRRRFDEIPAQASPYGQWLQVPLELDGQLEQVIFLHGGWGKIAAAGSTQFALDRWQPELVVNLGTCGGFKGQIERGEVILAQRTLVYDILEQMGDPLQAIERYTTEIDLSWLGERTPSPVRRGLLISADRDLVAEEVSTLRARYGACAGDWESGAIAWVAARSGRPCLILRGVTDLVDEGGGEAYGKVELFREQAGLVMDRLLAVLPGWLACWASRGNNK